MLRDRFVFGLPVSSSPRCAPSRILRRHPYSVAAKHPQRVGNASEGTGAVQQAVRCRPCDPPCSRIIASCDVFYTPRQVGKSTNAGMKVRSPKWCGAPAVRANAGMKVRSPKWCGALAARHYCPSGFAVRWRLVFHGDALGAFGIQRECLRAHPLSHSAYSQTS